MMGSRLTGADSRRAIHSPCAIHSPHTTVGEAASVTTHDGEPEKDGTSNEVSVEIELSFSDTDTSAAYLVFTIIEFPTGTLKVRTSTG